MNSNFTFKWSKVALSFLLTLCVTVGLNAQTITITAPASVAGDYPVKPAIFGPTITAGISGSLVLADDGDDMGGTTSTSDGCEAIVNDLTGAIALVDRGACGFTVKAINAQTAGAALVVVCNSEANAGAGSILMGGDDMGAMTVPSVMMSYDDCEILKAELGNGLAGTGNPFAAGETCSTAFDVAEGTHTAPALTGGGSLFNDATSTAWYTYTPATDGLLTVASCGGGADTRFYVWTDGCDLANITAIQTNDDACDLGDGNAWASSLDFLVTGGTQYWISWDDRWDASGFDFSITLGALPIVDVTLTVDMSNEMVAAGGAHFAGETNGWTGEPMTDNMDGTYSYTVSGVTAGDTIEYKFQNGLDGWEDDFAGTTCGLGNNRAFIVPITNATAGTVCFNSCDVCPPPACSDPDAIICDDLEDYSLSDISGQAAHWNPWSGTPGAGDDAVVSDAFAASGSQSLLVSEANGDDMLLLLGDQTTGNYLLTWKMYVPDGATGYFNTQKVEGSPGNEFGMQVEFFADGTMTLDAGAADVVTVNWDSDTWMDVALYVDLTNDWMTYYLNGTEVYSWPASWGTFTQTGTLQLGAINFFGNAGTEQYIDDILFKALPDCPADAVICDGYEAYVSGTTTGGQASWWSTWSGDFGTDEDGIVSSDQAFDGSNSMLVSNGGVQDVLLLLGNQTSGNWRVEMQMYVPTDAIGYYNIQEDETPGVQWNMEAWFNGTNANPSVYTPGMGQLASGETFTCPQDQWFMVASEIDLDNGTHTFTVDGNVVLDAAAYAGAQLGAIDFFSISNLHTAYFDAIRLIELEPVAPEPVDVTFNVNLTQVMDNMGGWIAGEFNAWTGEVMTDNGDMTYSITVPLTPGDTVEYKFQNGEGGWESDFASGNPDDCGLNNNRFVIVGDAAMNVDLVCFNECVDCIVDNIEDIEFNNSISIYPNPTSTFTNIEYNFEVSNDLRIELTNNLGQLVSSELLNSAQNGVHQLKVNDLASGVYFIHITNGEQSMVEKLFVD